MIIKNTLFCLNVLMLVGLSWSATVQTWTMAECIARAQEQSLTVQMAKFDEQTSESQLKQARNMLLPDLSASINQSLFDSPFASDPQDHYSLSLGLNSSIQLWNGGQQRNSIKQMQYLAQAARAGTEQVKRNLSEAVINGYLTYWSLRESESASQEVLLLSKANLSKDSVLFQSGSLVASELAFSEASVAGDSLALLQVRHSLTQAKTNLRQLLEFPLEHEWELAPPDTLVIQTSIPFTTVLSQGLENSVTRQIDSLNVMAAEAGIKKANGQKYPSISLGASAGTGLRAWQSDAYGDQIKTGYNHRLTLGIQIPIIDRGAAESSLLQAQIAKERTQLNAQTHTKQLENTLEKLTQQTEATRLQWETATLQYHAQETVLQIVNDKRALGVVDNLAFIQQKNLYQNAQAKLNQAKYSYLLGQALLKLYMEK